MNMRILIAEFIGTFALIFVGVGAIAANHALDGALGLTGIALAHGLTIAVMVSATAAISGGHLNPAVSFAFFLAGIIPGGLALLYVISQCLGAILAAFLISMAIPEATLTAVGMGTPGLGAGITVSQAVIMEIVLTFFLVYVVFGTAVSKLAPQMGGLFIGLTVTLDILVGGPISGAAMNPARHLGPALMGGGLDNIWIYWLAPFVGAGIACVAYKVTHAEDHMTDISSGGSLSEGIDREVPRAKVASGS